MLEFIPQILLICIGPAILMWALKDRKIGKVLSPVVMAYAVGIASVTFGLMPLNPIISKYFSELSIMLAIPLLLFSADILGWFRHARSTVLSFVFAIISAALSCIIAAYLFRDKVDLVWDYAAMLTGVYTGGTANMQAVGIAIGADEDSFALINSVEIVCGGIYLLFLTSFAPLLFGKVLPAYESDGNTSEIDDDPVEIKKDWKSMALATLLAIVILGVTLGLATALYGGLTNTTFIILSLTTLSVIASFSTKIRALRGSFEVGDYLLLMFCVAVGMRSDFGNIVEQGGVLLAFTALSWLLAIGFHLILSIIFRIDRDTTLITSTAALYGPAFIGQIASVLKNRDVVFAGIATGLVGYAIGNYLGISMHYLLEKWLA